MAESSKKTRGKQKIIIKKIENENDRMVTFSKRKSGIYKKAIELVTLTGAEVGFLVFSPTGKPYSFGHPSIEAISNRIMEVNVASKSTTHPLIEAHRQAKIGKLNQSHNNLICRLDAEKEHGKKLQNMKKGRKNKGWWEASIDQLNMEDLKEMDAYFEELSKELHMKINEKSFGGGTVC